MLPTNPLVVTKLGAVKGKFETANNGNQFYTFQNVPYAEPPIGALRFKAPQPVKPWSKEIDATVEGPECVSLHQYTFKPVGSEDCLKLNIYSNSIDSNVKLPVMVWIHGGGFHSGSGKSELYGPAYFMCEKIVLVCINYRLGIFGFLSLNDKTLGVPGNAGMKDQVMALKWIQENISHFGGDPNNVTVFGESAGSSAINYLLCSPMAKGLFHKVIMQSGSALNSWALGRGLPEELMEYFKIEGKSESALLDKLMECTKEELLTAQMNCKNLFCASEPNVFAPVIEGINHLEPSFLEESPLKLMNSGNYIKVPMIIGYNTQEGMLFDYMEEKYKSTNWKLINDFNQSIPYYYNLSDTNNIRKIICEEIKQFYFDGKDSSTIDLRKKCRDFQSDLYFLRGIYITMTTILRTNPFPIYFYRFAVDAQLNELKRLSKVTDEGASHYDDVFYMFSTMVTKTPEPNSIEDITIKRLTKMWSKFAKDSNPNSETPDELFNVNWPKTDGNNLLNIANNLEVIQFPELKRMEFWDKIDRLAMFNM